MYGGGQPNDKETTEKQIGKEMIRVKLGKSLRTSIAAYLALTLLTVPLAGCDFLDGLWGDGKPPVSADRRNSGLKLPV